MRLTLSAVVFVGIVFLAFGMRLVGLGSFMTADEGNWMIRSAEFWDKLSIGDPGGTFITTHPGAFPMIIMGLGIRAQEARLGIELENATLDQFRLAATIPVAFVTALGIGLCTYLLCRMTGLIPALFSGIFLSIDPYFTGLSQIAHLDAIVALAMLCAILAFFVYHHEYQYRWLVIAGISLGLAWSTKLLPSLWVPIVFLGIALAVRGKGIVTRSGVQGFLRSFLFVTGIAALTLFMTWPAMWVKDNLYGSFEHDVPVIVNDDHGVSEESANPIEPWTFYGRTVLSRVPLFYLILTVGGSIFFLRLWYISKRFPTLGWLYVYGTGFIFLISLAAKKSDRYALPALILFPVVAGYLWTAALAACANRFPSIKPRWLVSAAGLVVILLIVETVSWSPYTIAYNNPVLHLRPLPQQGWGEGLDQAADWLNTHPLGEKLTVASWYPTVLDTYFSGKVMSLSSRHDNRVGFIVTYRNMYGRGPDDLATHVIEELKHQTPVHTVYIHGLPYAWIYDTLGLPYFDTHVGELVGDMEVGQTVIVPTNTWKSIDIGMSTFSGRNNTEDVTVHIRNSVMATQDLRTIIIPANTIIDSDWNTITFDPIEGALQKEYFVSLTSTTAHPGNAVTVRFSNTDIRPGTMMLRRRALEAGETNEGFIKPEADLAYRFSHE